MKFSELQLMHLESMLFHRYRHWTEKVGFIREFIACGLVDLNTRSNIEV
jgi:hypothetical protein